MVFVFFIRVAIYRFVYVLIKRKQKDDPPPYEPTIPFMSWELQVFFLQCFKGSRGRRASSYPVSSALTSLLQLCSSVLYWPVLFTRLLACALYASPLFPFLLLFSGVLCLGVPSSASPPCSLASACCPFAQRPWFPSSGGLL
mmetsp:Transcript_43474/g.102686  ORF Transcript_43474/g.102686 Transcript_43474/m.102686 type:complete len:142 (-) Transcript_43474:42-467(-)